MNILLSGAKDSHTRIIPEAPPWRDRLTPPVLDLDEAAERVGVASEGADRRPVDAVVLYAVDSRRDRP